jgi:hypothetical protein
MKQDTPSNSAERVKAFRDRLDSQFKRVEAYVTEEEKTRIQAVRAHEGVTMDVAVAGLVRLGLEHYEALRAQEQQVAQPKTALNLCGALGGAAEAVAFGATAGASARGAAAPGLIAASVSLASAVAAPEQADNPVARFFKKRKEILNG